MSILNSFTMKDLEHAVKEHRDHLDTYGTSFSPSQLLALAEELYRRLEERITNGRTEDLPARDPHSILEADRNRNDR